MFGDSEIKASLPNNHVLVKPLLNGIVGRVCGADLTLVSLCYGVNLGVRTIAHLT